MLFGSAIDLSLSDFHGFNGFKRRFVIFNTNSSFSFIGESLFTNLRHKHKAIQFLMELQINHF